MTTATVFKTRSERKVEIRQSQAQNRVIKIQIQKSFQIIPVFHDLCMIYAAKIKQNSIPVVYNNEVTKLARKKIDI